MKPSSYLIDSLLFKNILSPLEIVSIINLFKYSFKEVQSYSELTKKEKECIDEKTFNKLFI